nr:MAG TPA: hypothetical protein [Caudoviricetes sp.]
MGNRRAQNPLCCKGFCRYLRVCHKAYNGRK